LHFPIWFPAWFLEWFCDRVGKLALDPVAAQPCRAKPQANEQAATLADFRPERLARWRRRRELTAVRVGPQSPPIATRSRHRRVD
jgi:hypothetical protein